MKKILDSIELFMLCFTVFVIPIHIKLSSISIGFLVLIALLKKENYSLFLSNFKNYKFWILVFPYILYWIGMIYTPAKHIKAGFQQIEIVSSLLVFPFIFISYSTNSIKNKIELINTALILGVLFSYFICLSIAIPKYISTKDFGILYYSRFSEVIKGPHHLSYHVIIAIMIIVLALFEKTPLLLTKRKYNGVKVILFVVCSVFLFQLSSKATILLYFLCMALIFGYTVIKRIIPLRIALPIIFTVILLSAFLYSLPNVKMRFNKMFFTLSHKDEINYKSQESTALRLAAFEAGKSIIKENFWIGVGTGELGYALSRYYKHHDFQGAYIKYISPHNQFVRSFAMHGLPGFLSLVAIFVLLFFLSLKHSNPLMFLWALIMLVLFNVEDMFGIQDGIVFFCFYTAYFVFNPKDCNVTLSQKSGIYS
jgi:O-antigen ligase